MLLQGRRYEHTCNGGFAERNSDATTLVDVHFEKRWNCCDGNLKNTKTFFFFSVFLFVNFIYKLPHNSRARSVSL